MKNSIGTDLSGTEFFDYWSKLAKEDPSRFEEERRRAVEDAISQAPTEHQERLRRLQWRIDAERSRAANPLAACVALNRMLWKFICAPNGFLAVWERFSNGDMEFFRRYNQSPAHANVLPFKK